jgi:hypothetical protein
MTTRKPKAFADVRKETAERMAEPEDYLPCRFCGTATPRATLSNLGARCQPCFDQYLLQGYSGAERPRQARQCPEVRADQARIAAYRGDRAAPPNAFATLSEAIEAKRAQRSIPLGLADDDVNALLQAERS